MSRVTEIAPDVFRISTFIPSANLQSNQFLVRDEEPLLFHTGLRVLFPEVRGAVGAPLDPTSIRWIGVSHTEPILNRLAALQPRILATMHGSTFLGDGARALRDLAQTMKDVLGHPAAL